MKPDIILAWPRSCDFPLWRQMLRANRHRFHRVIIVFTETHYGEDYRDFLRQAMKEDRVIFVDNPPVRGDEDWRNVAVNTGLLYSTSNWIWFTEQDFLPTTDLFWEQMYYLPKHFDVFGAFADTRFHPCCIFINKRLLDETPKRFGVVTDKLDHFGQIQLSLETRGVKIAKMDPDTYHHMNGLSQNYSMAYKGETITFKLEEFKEYLANCLKLDIPMDPRFVAFANQVLNTT